MKHEILDPFDLPPELEAKVEQMTVQAEKDIKEMRAKKDNNQLLEELQDEAANLKYWFSRGVEERLVKHKFFGDRIDEDAVSDLRTRILITLAKIDQVYERFYNATPTDVCQRADWGSCEEDFSGES